MFQKKEHPGTVRSNPVGVIVLIAGPLAKIAAYGAIAYGAWTIWKSE